jgi:hypothetical protein
VSFQGKHYARKPNLRIRHVEGQDTWLVYTPETPRLCSLNLTSRMLLELCDGRRGAEIEDAFSEAAGDALSRDAARRYAADGVRMLVRREIVDVE